VKRILVLLVLLGWMTGIALAHNGMEHVVGTVAAISDTSITVTTTAGKSQVVVLNTDTKYSRMDQTITAKEVKVGDHVVVHATNKGGHLTAATVAVGTSPAAQQRK
jgi:hypothetical protein